jgi:alpha,alpha-trehalose phosphorylase
MLRRRLNLPQGIFPENEWLLEGVRFTPEFVSQVETIGALSNGYLGMRGSHEEGRPVGEPGTFLNGLFEFRPIEYGEHAYGFPKFGQTMLNCPDGKPIKLYIDDEPFDLTTAEILSYQRCLDMKEAIGRRTVVWRTPTGKRLRLSTSRLVSFAHRHCAAMMYELELQDEDARLIISSELINRKPIVVETGDPRMGRPGGDRVFHPCGHSTRDRRAVLSFTTDRSEMTLGCGMDHTIQTDCVHTFETTASDDFAALVLRVEGRTGSVVRLWKYLAYHYGSQVNPAEIRARTDWTLDHAVQEGFDQIAERQRVFMDAFWERADVLVEGDEEQRQQVIRWNLFQLLQASARAEGHGIGARGLTGQTYEGHYFWDTEIYVLPFLLYTQPAMARSVLKHRYDGLDKARARARELRHPGATFPWRTINGEEASAYYAAGTAQYHINADISYAIKKYVEVTADTAFLYRYGAEILVETARFWEDLGGYVSRNGERFVINGVTGPDEYTAVVNNNFFTNVMAQLNLRYAADTVETMCREDKAAFSELAERTGLRPGETNAWRRAADKMYVPYDGTLGIHPQDDSFLDKELWDFENTAPEDYPLLLHYHPLNLYRHQVIKQADTILAMFLLGDQFDLGDKKRNFAYYDPLTTHDSSLSVCIQSIIACEIGDLDKALEYFNFAAVMDLADVGGNMKHGAHIASIGGTWMALVYGFGGLRDFGGVIRFAPRLPEAWSRLCFRLTIRGNLLRVNVRHEKTRYELLRGDGLTIHHHGKPVELVPARPNRSLPTVSGTAATGATP